VRDAWVIRSDKGRYLHDDMLWVTDRSLARRFVTRGVALAFNSGLVTDGRHVVRLRQKKALKDLLAHATSFVFGDYEALRIVSCPPAKTEIWRVRDRGGFDVRSDMTRDEAIRLARGLAEQAKEAT
jgi:hypothetical protein